MELKLTTKKALEYEERTGNDIVTKLQEIGETGAVKIKDVVDLFAAMGDNYTVDVFDAWDATFVNKAAEIFNEVRRFIGGENEKK